MKKGFAVVPIILGVAIISLIGVGFLANRQNNNAVGGTPTAVSSSTSINQLYGEVNNLVNFVTGTSSLGVLSGLSSTTGNLIVGSSSNWIAKTVGANNLYLMASSTAQGGLSWESLTGVSTSTANSWSALQTFNAGISVTSIAGVSATSTLNLNTVNASTSALANVSSTNINASGYGTFPTLNFTNASGTQITASIQGSRGDLTNVSSTNINVSGYGTFPTLNFTNSSGTQLTLSAGLQSARGDITNVSSTRITVSTSLDGARIDVTNVSSTNGTITTFQFTNASGTNVTASGFLQGATLNISGQSTLATVSSTNVTASGFFQGATLNISGQSTLGSVSSTQFTSSIYGLFPGILRVPSGSAPTSTEAGGISHDTSQNQLLVFGSSTVNVVQLGSEFRSGIVTSPTSTIDYTAFVNLPFEVSLDRVYCGTDVLSTAITLNLWRRTNPTAATTSLAGGLICNPTGYTTTSFSNGGGASSTFIIGFSFSAVSGTPNNIPVSFWYRYPRY